MEIIFFRFLNMIFLRLFFLIFLFCSYSFSQQNVNITFKLYTMDSLSVHTMSNVKNHLTTIYTDTIINIGSMGYNLFYIQKNQNKCYLFLHPSYDLTITSLEGDEFLIEGDGADFNTFINQYFNVFKPQVDSLLLEDYFSDQFEIALYDLMNNNIMSFYQNHTLFSQFENDAKKYFEHFLKYTYLDALSKYLIKHKKDTNHLMPSYDDINLELLNRDLFHKALEDTTYYSLDVFQSYISNSIILYALFDYQYSSKNNDNFAHFNRYIFNFIEKKIPKKIWIFFLHHYMSQYAHYIDKSTMSYLDKMLQQGDFTKNTIQSILDYYDLNNEKNTLFNHENDVVSHFEFYMENQKGDLVSLDDFQGKILYIDIWASWCGPCRKQFPYAKKLQKQFSRRALKKIEFIYISIDNDYDKWIESLGKLNLTGHQFISPANHNNGAGNYFNVSSIPRYIIIGKQGEIVNQNAKRPSDETLFHELMDLIKQ